MLAWLPLKLGGPPPVVLIPMPWMSSRILFKIGSEAPPPPSDGVPATEEAGCTQEPDWIRISCFFRQRMHTQIVCKKKTHITGRQRDHFGTNF